MSDTPHASWTVQSQNQRTKATPGGQIEDGYEVNFQTGQGHFGTVFLPLSRYTPDNVRAAVQAQADLLDSIGALTSDGS